jgi:CheY-like chemotaxis protein
VVDDVAENRDVLSRMLESLGCAVSNAETGERGVQLALTERPDIVFMDIRLPGIDGVEAVRRIKAGRQASEPAGRNPVDVRAAADNATLPPAGQPACGPAKFVCFSASALAHEQQRYLDAGFDDFIGKPFRYEQFVECLARLLKVRFEDAPDAAEAEADSGLPVITLPPALGLRLREAAERASATRLTQACTELEVLGEAGSRFAGRLSALAQAGDFEGILSLLDSREGNRE